MADQYGHDSLKIPVIHFYIFYASKFVFRCLFWGFANPKRISELQYIKGLITHIQSLIRRINIAAKLKKKKEKKEN